MEESENQTNFVLDKNFKSNRLNKVYDEWWESAIND